MGFAEARHPARHGPKAPAGRAIGQVGPVLCKNIKIEGKEGKFWFLMIGKAGLFPGRYSFHINKINQQTDIIGDHMHFI